MSQGIPEKLRVNSGSIIMPPVQPSKPPGFRFGLNNQVQPNPPQANTNGSTKNFRYA